VKGERENEGVETVPPSRKPDRRRQSVPELGKGGGTGQRKKKVH